MILLFKAILNILNCNFTPQIPMFQFSIWSKKCQKILFRIIAQFFFFDDLLSNT